MLPAVTPGAGSALLRVLAAVAVTGAAALVLLSATGGSKLSTNLIVILDYTPGAAAD
jgi:hypothetical protein